MRWVERMREPAGAVPPNLRRLLVWGGIGVLVLAVGWSTWQQETAAPPEEPNPAELQSPPAPEVMRRAGETVESSARKLDEGERLAALADAGLRLEEQKRRRALQATVGQYLADPSGTPPPSQQLPPDQYEPDDIVAEEIRQTEARRRYESLRAPQIVLAADRARDPRAASPPASATGSPAAANGAAGDPEGAAAADPVSELLQRVLEEPERYAALMGGAAPARPAAPPANPAGEAPAAPAEGPAPAALSAPRDPPGWERVHEGSFLECVLLTQLRGDFPGPVSAMVAVDFWSRDRQRILIPRGSRALGSASAVSQWGQARLAVAFHRLLLPDGRSADLQQFTGLNQVGETGLKDRVNNHYASVFGAAAAVGLLSGLASQNTSVFGTAQERIRSGAGAGLAQQGTTIMERFLNRLPTVTIRAGHRVRVWFSSDVLVPRPQAAPRGREGD